jgi:hypothetical protein
MIANIPFAKYRSCRPSSTGSMRTEFLVETTRVLSSAKRVYDYQGGDNCFAAAWEALRIGVPRIARGSRG